MPKIGKTAQKMFKHTSFRCSLSFDRTVLAVSTRKNWYGNFKQYKRPIPNPDPTNPQLVSKPVPSSTKSYWKKKAVAVAGTNVNHMAQWLNQPCPPSPAPIPMTTPSLVPTVTPAGCEDLVKLSEETGDAMNNASDNDNTALDSTGNANDSDNKALYTSDEVAAENHTYTVTNHKAWLASCIWNYCSKDHLQPH
ncbi:hypothetical protein CROQUDRAFT_95258 [Cronartium quercuum f. sp. fusiforme G11]|uniref:Uncharacterized protein n=1 Tax=Cronartium quercuum f. sp. fusiforme G11 TaxID=708437 RepID=A0A9P6NIK8_9BASI|nr:hypothetical protein CROQUDRAFT_95258 [Cronartium quercuum f. sp. fusiforme G11]